MFLLFSKGMLPAQEILFDRYGHTISAIERFSIKTGQQPPFHQGLRKFERKELIHYLLRVNKEDSLLHPLDREDLEIALSKQYIPALPGLFHRIAWIIQA